MEYIDVSEFTLDTGFQIYNCPGGIDISVWNDCIQSNEKDNEAQTYQEEDARLRDISVRWRGETTTEPSRNISEGFSLRSTFIAFLVTESQPNPHTKTSRSKCL